LNKYDSKVHTSSNQRRRNRVCSFSHFHLLFVQVLRVAVAVHRTRNEPEEIMFVCSAISIFCDDTTVQGRGIKLSHTPPWLTCGFCQVLMGGSVWCVRCLSLVQVLRVAVAAHRTRNETEPYTHGHIQTA
jgi:hypothetical protein